MSDGRKLVLVPETVVYKIKLRGEDLIYIGDRDKKDGALTTRERFEKSEMSFGHLFMGNVWQNGRVIGEASEVEFGEMEEGSEFQNPVEEEDENARKSIEIREG